MGDFDVVVIGSGLGGMSAACTLSRSGKKVLVLEKHNVPGGYASSFLRGRFEFDASLHQLCGLGTKDNPGPLWGLFEGLGINSKVEFVQIPEFFRCRYPGFDITVPVGRENFVRTMTEAFPDDAEGIKRFIDTMFEFAGESLEFVLSGKKVAETGDDEYLLLKQYANLTVNEVLYPMVSDGNARIVLSQFCNYMGQDGSRVAFFGYAMGFSNFVRLGPAHIKGTSQALSQAMADIVIECGGDVWLNNGARKINLSDGRISGVTTENGTEIKCKYVVSNLNPFTTAYTLIGAEQTPDWYLRRIGKWTPGIGTINIFLGLDVPHEKLGLLTHELFYVVKTGDWAKLDSESRTRVDYEPFGAGITSYSTSDDSFSPPGTSVVVITMGGAGAAWKQLSPSEYIEAKNRWAEKGLKFLEELVPDIRDHIEVMEVATPLTNMAYSGNPGGSYLGFVEARQVPDIERLPFRGPLEGLYFCGAWVDIGGGYLPSLLSGFRASGFVMEDMNQPEKGRLFRKEWETTVRREQENESDTGSRAAEAISGVTPKYSSTRIELVVDAIKVETPSAKTIRLTAASGALPYFRPGQYFNLFVEIDGVLTSRPYTIASVPGEPWYDITVRRKEGGFVSHYLLDRLKEGETLYGSVPSGVFYHNPVLDSGQLVLLAGGCGITPFISMIRQTASQGLPLDIHLIYGSRLPSDIIFREELESLSARHPNIRADFVISEPPDDWDGPKGFLDADTITSLAGTLAGKTVFVCGPPLMYDLCGKALEELQVPRNRIRFEMSGPPADVTREKGWPGLATDQTFEIIEERSGSRFTAKAGEPLLVSMERFGIVVPSICRSGVCTACRTRLLEGRVFVPDSVHVRKADHRANYIHACMSYPLENLRIRI